MISSDQRSPNISSEILTGQPDRRGDSVLLTGHPDGRGDFASPGTAATLSSSLAQCNRYYRHSSGDPAIGGHGSILKPVPRNRSNVINPWLLPDSPSLGNDRKGFGNGQPPGLTRRPEFNGPEE